MVNRLQTLFLLPDNSRAFNLAERNLKILLSVLVVLLIGAGVFTEQLFQALDQFYFKLFSSLDLYWLLQKSQAQVSAKITMRSWPTMFSYGLLYTGLSFFTLHVYFNRYRKTRLAAGFYLGIFLLCALLILLGKVLPNGLWAYMLCRRLIEMIISPLPVILLIAALSTLKDNPRVKAD